MPAKRAKQADKIRLDITGDIFIEEFIWPSPSVLSNPPLPFAMPEELRSANPTVKANEISGAFIHNKIIALFMKAFGIRSLNQQSIPDEAILKAAYGNLQIEPSVPVYLHELGPYTRRDGKAVWRIKKSFGSMQLAGVLRNGIPQHVPLADTPQEVNDAITAWVDGLGKSNSPRIVVINDRNSTDPSREKTNTRAWLKALLNSNPTGQALSKVSRKNTLILWHVRHPLFDDNPIAEWLQRSDLASCTIPIVNSNCLREEGVNLRFDVSYESTLKGLASSLNSPVMTKLAAFPSVIIQFDYGILHLIKQPEGWSADVHGLKRGLFWIDVARDGMVTGNTPLLICCIIREACEHVNAGGTLAEFLDRACVFQFPTQLHSTRLDRAIDAGILLAAMRFEAGYGDFGPSGFVQICQQKGTLPIYDSLAKDFASRSKFKTSAAGGYILQFRHESLNAELIRTSLDCTLESVRSGARLRTVHARHNCFANNTMMRLSEGIASCFGEDTDALLSVSSEQMFNHSLRSIVKIGLNGTLKRKQLDTSSVMEPSYLFPFVSFGGYDTIDPYEIDGLLAIRRLVESYTHRPEFKKPLSIAVFGAPGSGKSFIVKKCLSEIEKCFFDDGLSLNLSQERSTAGLSHHFHTIQDASARAGVPIAFFDEFDCAFEGVAGGWLKYFLMPMQDGQYVEGNSVFDVSRAIFVFAGGNTPTFQKFVSQYGNDSAVKGPDFISRLRGHYDVTGLDFPDRPQDDRIRLSRKRAVQVRRAVILRGLLPAKIPQVFDKDSKVCDVRNCVIDAFMQAPFFTHGVRSMEAILDMSRVPSGASGLLPAHLPSYSQLRAHVDAKGFLKMIAKSDL